MLVCSFLHSLGGKNFVMFQDADGWDERITQLKVMSFSKP